MSKQARIAHLSWLLAPIQKSVEAAKLSLDAYHKKVTDLSKSPADPADSVFVSQALLRDEHFAKLEHAVDLIHASLAVAGSSGGFGLATEVKATLARVREKKITEDQVEKALITVMASLFTIPKFMAMVIEGAPDTPGVLAKQINELREINGISLLDEGNLLSPEVEIVFVTPPHQVKDSTADDRDQVFKTASKSFQLAFSAYIQNQSKPSLGEMRSLLLDLERVTQNVEVGCFWWIGQGLMDALEAGAIRSGGQVLSQIRVLSVAIQKISLEGEEGALATLGVQRFKSLMSVLSLSARLPQPVQEMMAVFNVNTSVDSASIEALQNRIESSHSTTIKDVVPELKPLLESSMISLGRAITSKSAASFDAQMGSFLTSIRHVASVFYMVNESELAAIAANAMARVEDVTSPTEFDDDLVESLKADFMFLDERIDHLDANDAVRALKIPGIKPEVVDIVVAEALKALAKTRRLVTNHMDSGTSSGDLKDGLSHLLHAANALEFTGVTFASQVLNGSCQAFLSLLENGSIVPSASVDKAACALVAVEVYLQSISQRLEPAPSLLEQAAKALAEVGITIQKTESITNSELLSKFEEAKIQNDLLRDDADAHFHSEILELRVELEKALDGKNNHLRKPMNDLYMVAERLAMAAKLNGVDNLSRLARSLATYCQSVQTQSTAASFNVQECQQAVKTGLEMCLRCLDEYSARGKVTIFTRDIEQTLLSLSDPAVEMAFDSDEDPDSGAANTTEQSVVVVLEGELISDDQAVEERDYPDDVDAVLVDMYREEFHTYHSILSQVCSVDSPLLTKDVCRAAHSIHGISGSSGCFVLHKVYGAIEERLDYLLANDLPLSSSDVSTLQVLLDETAEFLKDFPWTLESPLLESWLDTALQIGAESDDAVFTEISSEPVPVAQPEAAEKIPHAETIEGPVPSTDRVLIAPEKPAFDASTTDAPAPVEYKNAEFYLEDADDVMPELQSNVEQWLFKMTDVALVETIKRNMHTLKGAAAMAEATSIADITHQLETLFESLTYDLIPASPECARLVSYSLDVITTMTALMRQGFPYQRPVALIECLEHAVDTNTIDLGILDKDRSGLTETTQGTAVALLEPSESNLLVEDDTAPALLQEPEVAAEVDQIILEAEQAVEIEPQTVAEPLEAIETPSRRRRRGGRGRGGAAKPGVRTGEGQAVPTAQEATAPSEIRVDAYAVPEEVIEAKPDAEPTAQPIDTPELTQEAPEADLVPTAEKFTHAETSDSLEMAILPPALVQEPSVKVPFLSGLGLGPVHAPMPVQSQQIMDLLRKEDLSTGAESRARNVGSTEKMKVDLRLLEGASEQSSELIAGCYRLDSMNEDVTTRLSTLHEQMQAHILKHGHLTTVMRGHFNNHEHSQNSQGSDELERFNDISSIHVSMGASSDEMLEELKETMAIVRQMRESFQDQGKLIGSLQRDLVDSRLVPFQNIVPKLTQALKQVCSATGKSVEPTFVGADVIMDKIILDSIAEPLTHILRNAIDHGIESQKDRVGAGKPTQARITIQVQRIGKNAVISITDDGKGMDSSVIRKKAIEKGLILESDKLSEKETLRLVTANGFSTAETLTAVSGRGVGMNIVASAVENLGGQLHIETTLGKGTTFHVELPFTIGTNRAALVSSGTQWFAIQSYSMSQIIMVDRKDLEDQRLETGHASVVHDDLSYEVIHLADLIAMPDSRGQQPPQHFTKLVLCTQGETRFAVEVEGIDSMPQIHVRKLEGILSQVRGIIGETEMQNGDPVFVLDVMELARVNLKKDENGHYHIRQNRVRLSKRDLKPVAFVIDDSRMFRNHLERVFTAMGYRVITAVNGQNALHKLTDMEKPEFIIVDVEMPEMNGFEFTERVRAMRFYDDLPIMMMTTKYQYEERAMSIGVDVFLKKPSDVPELQKAIFTSKNLRKSRVIEA